MKTEYQNCIISRLRNYRMELGFSQKKIATLLGVSPGQVGNIESPQAPTKYTLRQINKLCDLFKIPIEQIFLEDKDFLKHTNIINILITNIIKYEENYE